MACIGCDFNLFKQRARGLVLQSKASVRRYLEEVPLTPDERAIVEQDVEKIELALKRLSLKTRRVKRAAMFQNGRFSYYCVPTGESVRLKYLLRN